MPDPIARWLDPGERVLWSGRPRQGIYLRPSDMVLVPFSLMWGGFFLAWEYIVLTADDVPIPLALFGIPFVAMGIYAIVGRFFADAMLRAGTYYAVTERRAIIVSRADSLAPESVELCTLKDVSIEDERETTGTIFLGGQPSLLSRGWHLWPRSRRFHVPHFEQIENARRVFNLIRMKRHAATPRSSPSPC